MVGEVAGRERLVAGRERLWDWEPLASTLGCTGGLAVVVVVVAVIVFFVLAWVGDLAGGDKPRGREVITRLPE